MATAALGRDLRSVVFRFSRARIPRARSVAVVGSFNEWDPSAHRLRRESDEWTIAVSLPPGRYAYLFLVDGVAWNDPDDDGRVPCEWGGAYSVRAVR